MALNPTPSLLDPGQIIKRVFDKDNDAIRTDASVSIVGDIQVDISAADGDNISLNSADGTMPVGVTAVGGQNGLDVNIIGGVVSGTFSPTGLTIGMATTLITITDVATPIPGSPLTNRNGLSARVMGTNTVYFGNSSVDSASGYPKFQFEEITIDIRSMTSNTELYGICESGKTCDVRVFEVA